MGRCFSLFALFNVNQICVNVCIFACLVVSSSLHVICMPPVFCNYILAVTVLLSVVQLQSVIPIGIILIGFAEFSSSKAILVNEQFQIAIFTKWKISIEYYTFQFTKRIIENIFALFHITIHKRINWEKKITFLIPCK